MPRQSGDISPQELDEDRFGRLLGRWFSLAAVEMIAVVVVASFWPFVGVASALALLAGSGIFIKLAIRTRARVHAAQKQPPACASPEAILGTFYGLLCLVIALAWALIMVAISLLFWRK